MPCSLVRALSAEQAETLTLTLTLTLTPTLALSLSLSLSLGLPLPLSLALTLTEQAECFVNKRSEGMWKQAPCNSPQPPCSRFADMRPPHTVRAC